MPQNYLPIAAPAVLVVVAAVFVVGDRVVVRKLVVGRVLVVVVVVAVLVVVAGVVFVVVVVVVVVVAVVAVVAEAPVALLIARAKSFAKRIGFRFARGTKNPTNDLSLLFFNHKVFLHVEAFWIQTCLYI